LKKNPRHERGLRRPALQHRSCQGEKRAAAIVFARQSTPEVITVSRPVTRSESLLESAEQQLASGDALGAQKLATEALKSPRSNAEPGRAFFILARASLLLKNLEGAQQYFERAIESAHDPRTLAWSHIYLGRILDIQEQRDTAVTHYRAALNAETLHPTPRPPRKKAWPHPIKPKPRPRTEGGTFVHTEETAFRRAPGHDSLRDLPLCATASVRRESGPGAQARTTNARRRPTSSPDSTAGQSAAQAKTKDEYKAYTDAAAVTGGAAMEKAALDFAGRFPDSQLTVYLYSRALHEYQNENNPPRSWRPAGKPSRTIR